MWKLVDRPLRGDQIKFVYVNMIKLAEILLKVIVNQADIDKRK